MATEGQNLSANIMTDTKQINGDQRSRTDKFGIAAHFDVGVRTIENWLARGIISAPRKGRKLEFDVEECDRRVSCQKN